MKRSTGSDSEHYNPASLNALDTFQEDVQRALRGSDDHYRQFMARCLQGELTADQTTRILAVCRQFEREHKIRPALIWQDGQQLKVQQNDQSLTLLTGRVAVLFGVVYYLGAGLSQNDQLAQRYFKVGMTLGLSDAFVFAGIMARKGHGEPEGMPNYPHAQQCFATAMANNNPEAYLQSAEMLLQEHVPDQRMNTESAEGLLAIGDLLQKGADLTTAAGIPFGEKRKMDLASSLVAMQAIKNFKTSIIAEVDEQALSAELRVKTVFAKAYRQHRKNSLKVLREKLATASEDEKVVFSQSGDPYILYWLAQDAVSKAKMKKGPLTRSDSVGLTELLSTTETELSMCSEGDENVSCEGSSTLAEKLSGASMLFHRAYQTYARLRQQSHCEDISKRFSRLLTEPLLQDIGKDQLRYHFYAADHDKSLLELSNAIEGYDPYLLGSLLTDTVSSRRERMVHVLALTGGKIPHNLFNDPYDNNQLLHGLGLLAVEALDDTLALGSVVDAQYHDEIAEEARQRFTFLNTVVAELQRRYHFAESLSLAQLPVNYAARLKADVEHCLNDCHDRLVASGYHGFSTALYAVIQHTPEPDNSNAHLSGDNQLTFTLSFKDFQSDKPLLSAVIQAIQQFEALNDQPSTLRFFGGGQGCAKERATQLSTARKLLRRCEQGAFSSSVLAEAILKCLKKSTTLNPGFSFAWVLMKTLVSGQPDAILPKEYFNPTALKPLEPQKSLQAFCAAFEDCFLPSRLVASSDCSIASGFSN